jgi:hypothetical protein
MGHGANLINSGTYSVVRRLLACVPTCPLGKANRTWQTWGRVFETTRSTQGRQGARWQRSIEVIQQEGERRQCRLFTDREGAAPPEAADVCEVLLSSLSVRHPRQFGAWWLGSRLWQELGLDTFFAEALQDRRGPVAWSKVIELLAVNRLCDPQSELGVHQRWFGATAMDMLLGTDEAVAAKDRLYPVASVLATDRSGSRLSDAQKRVDPAAHLAPDSIPGRSSHPGRLPGLLLVDAVLFFILAVRVSGRAPRSGHGQCRTQTAGPFKIVVEPRAVARSAADHLSVSH